jgi:hypothetical protein
LAFLVNKTARVIHVGGVQLTPGSPVEVPDDQLEGDQVKQWLESKEIEKTEGPQQHPAGQGSPEAAQKPADSANPTPPTSPNPQAGTSGQATATTLPKTAQGTGTASGSSSTSNPNPPPPEPKK